MTTTYRYQKPFLQASRRRTAGSRNWSLHSPATLMVLLALLFIFFLTASNGPDYIRRPSGNTEGMGKSTRVSDPVMIYNTVVREADAIRSVLQ